MLRADHGFDPLGLGSSPEQLSWNVHAEVFHGRLAMTGVAGILLTSVRQWWHWAAGLVCQCQCTVVAASSEMPELLSHWPIARHSSTPPRPHPAPPQLLHAGGADVPEWFEAGKVYLERNPNVSFGALVYTTIVLSGFVEFKRLNDIRNPGSQGSGILPEDFKGVGE